ncbi:hypothetical protein DH2020_031887 [Rehmannia glutinosa]|uniref:Protodermal factor 1 n=1 Tax=Rehmannia glutinosa TaxID=99300 RepID=A0ABR0VK21_REHGL
MQNQILQAHVCPLFTLIIPSITPPHVTPTPPSQGGGSYGGTPPSHGGGGYGGTPPSHGGGGTGGTPPSHGGGGYGGTPPSHGGGSYGGTPPANCGTPPSGGHHHPTPSPPTGGGGGYYPPPTTTPTTPTTPTPVIVSPPSIITPPIIGTPPIDPGTPSIPGITIPSPPFPFDPNSPPFTCTYWRNHPTLIWGLFGFWGTSVGSAFGVTSLPGFGLNMNILQALSNTRSDGLGELYREGTAALLNSIAHTRFPYTTSQVRDSFVAALGSNKAAAAQARLFKMANEGRIKPRA